MDIKAVTSGLPTPLLDALRKNAAAQRAAPPVQATQAGSFTGALDKALKAVSATQDESTRMAQAFQMDPAGTSLEQTMVSTQKSQIAFQSALHVRNRLVSAYSDIMNMQV